MGVAPSVLPSFPGPAPPQCPGLPSGCPWAGGNSDTASPHTGSPHALSWDWPILVGSLDWQQQQQPRGLVRYAPRGAPLWPPESDSAFSQTLREAWVHAVAGEAGACHHGPSAPRLSPPQPFSVRMPFLLGHPHFSLCPCPSLLGDKLGLNQRRGREPVPHAPSRPGGRDAAPPRTRQM